MTEARAPDPVSEGAAYRSYLIGLVGDDDPAEVQLGTTAALRAAVASAADALRTPPAPGEWSVVQLLGHVHDAEVVTSARYRWVLAHDEPELVGYDQDLWVDGLGHADADPDELISVFDALRQANVALWRRTGPAGRARSGIHSERGPESFEELFVMLAGHDRFHLAQMDRTLAAVRPQ